MHRKRKGEPPLRRSREPTPSKRKVRVSAVADTPRAATAPHAPLLAQTCCSLYLLLNPTQRPSAPSSCPLHATGRACRACSARSCRTARAAAAPSPCDLEARPPKMPRTALSCPAPAFPSPELCGSSSSSTAASKQELLLLQVHAAPRRQLAVRLPREAKHLRGHGRRHDAHAVTHARRAAAAASQPRVQQACRCCSAPFQTPPR